MNASAKATSLSRMDIRRLTDKIKSTFGVPRDKPFPIMKFLEYCSDDMGFTWEIVSDGELLNSYAESIPEKNLLLISLSTYNGARAGNPRDRFTIAHEIGHLFLHTPDRITFARAQEQIKPFQNPEWQANTFAGELLVSTDFICGLTVREVALKYNVSKKVAEIQLGRI